MRESCACSFQILPTTDKQPTSRHAEFVEKRSQSWKNETRSSGTFHSLFGTKSTAQNPWAICHFGWNLYVQRTFWRRWTLRQDEITQLPRESRHGIQHLGFIGRVWLGETTPVRSKHIPLRTSLRLQTTRPPHLQSLQKGIRILQVFLNRANHLKRALNVKFWRKLVFESPRLNTWVRKHGHFQHQSWLPTKR